jgi:hypothetical protein
VYKVIIALFGLYFISTSLTYILLKKDLLFLEKIDLYCINLFLKYKLKKYFNILLIKILFSGVFFVLFLLKKYEVFFHSLETEGKYLIFLKSLFFILKAVYLYLLFKLLSNIFNKIESFINYCFLLALIM